MTAAESYAVVLVTVPSADKAAEIARLLVDQRLAACVNIVPQVRSIYRWEGVIHDDTETLLLIKTKRELFEELRTAVIAKHPSEVPEIISLALSSGHSPYLAWVNDNTASTSS